MASGGLAGWRARIKNIYGPVGNVTKITTGARREGSSSMRKPRMLDLFAGRFGWGKAFAARGWEVVGVDLTEPPEVPVGCTFYQLDILTISRVQGWMADWDFDFICASSPCEQFSVHGMKHFHPNPPYPELGLRLFNHTRALCEASGLPYVMENVRAAQAFVGNAVNHCGPFYLWGNSVPPLMAQGISKGIAVGSSKAIKGLTLEQRREYRKQFPWNQQWSKSKQGGRNTAEAATIPPELSACVADYAGRILEVRHEAIA
jgi:C-5 cytosine-specific DNA methylase